MPQTPHGAPPGEALKGDWAGWTRTPMAGGERTIHGPGGVKLVFNREGWGSTFGRVPKRTSKPWAAFGADGTMLRDKRDHPRTFGSSETARKALTPGPVAGVASRGPHQATA